MKKFFVTITFLVLSILYSVASAPTDYFRSVQNGDWGSLATWESSADNANWFPATLIPASTANTISIIAHTITINTNQDMDQVIMYLGSVIVHNAGTLSVNDGAGDDILVLGGSTFQLSVNPGPVFLGAANIRIENTGTLMLSAGGLTGAGSGVNAANYVYSHQSILEYTLPLAFSTSGVTYFPNVAADTIPIFRITNNIGIVGAIANTTFNGVFEANGNITFANSGTKTFRNGIDGTGDINGSGSGKFIVNGNTARFGGTGILTLPAVAGMDIGNGTGSIVYLASSKTINNNMALLNNTYFILLTSDLTVNGTITGGSATAHFVTNVSGKLVINNIGATPVNFPIGASIATYNPIILQNGGGLNYGLRVEVGINPPIAVPLSAVNRTWFISSGAPPGTVDINFNYVAADCNANWIPPPATLELGILFMGVWNVVQNSLIQAPLYQVTTTVNTIGTNDEAPMVLANIGAILALENSITVNYFTGIKQTGQHLLKWKLTCSGTPSVTMFLQRSTNSIDYETIFSEQATALRCQQPFEYNDGQPVNGVNYYRIKMINADGKVTYSTIVPLINAVKGIDVMNIAPNPVVNSAFNLKVSAATKEQMEIIITDMQGRILQKQSVSLIAGFNNIPMNVKNLAAGTYQLFGNTADGKTRVLRFVIQ